MPGSDKKPLVLYDPDAVIDLAGVKDRQERKAVYNAVDKLRQLGDKLPAPHSSAIKGEHGAGLRELRPRAGKSYLRPIYRRFGEYFVILSIAQKDDFASGVGDAAKRSQQYVG